MELIINCWVTSFVGDTLGNGWWSGQGKPTRSQLGNGVAGSAFRSGLTIRSKCKRQTVLLPERHDEAQICDRGSLPAKDMLTDTLESRRESFGAG